MTEKLTKEECTKALNGLYFSDRSDDRDDEFYDVLLKLINEQFDNPPLSLEEIKERDWVWDNFYKVYTYVFAVDIIYESGEIIVTEDDYVPFEPNRFYRKQVEE